MKKRNIILIGIWFCLLTFLIVASFTDLIFKEDQEKVYNIAVVLDNDQKIEYENFKAGITEALKGKSVKVYYINLFGTDRDSIKEKLETQCRKRDMVIVRCDSNAILSELTAQINTRGKLFCINAKENPKGSLCNLSADDRKRGILLGKRILEEQKQGKHIYVFGSTYEKLEQDESLIGLDEQIKVTNCMERSEEEIRNRISQIKASGEEAVLVAMKLKILKDLVEIQVKENTRYPLYGFGYDREILAFMEEGKIQAVNIVPEYYLGYLAMTQALEAIEQKQKLQNQEMESYTIGSNEIFLEKYEDILFPKK